MPFPDLGAIAWGDAPTWGLLIGAGITSWYAARAFGKQSAELNAVNTEVQHGQELIEQQAKLIEIQSGQLDEQKRLSSEQIGVLDFGRPGRAAGMDPGHPAGR